MLPNNHDLPLSASAGEARSRTTIPLMDAATTWAAVGALGTVAAAGIAAWAARQSKESAAEANAAADSLAAIERGRRHDEVSPEFEPPCAGTTSPRQTRS